MAAKQLNNVRHQGWFLAGNITSGSLLSLMWRTRPFERPGTVSPALNGSVSVVGTFDTGTATLEVYDGVQWVATSFTLTADGLMEPINLCGLAFRVSFSGGGGSEDVNVAVVADAAVEEVIED